MILQKLHYLITSDAVFYDNNGLYDLFFINLLFSFVSALGAVSHQTPDEMEEVGAVLGDTQRFECKVIGFPMPTIRWFKDGNEISANGRYENEFNRDLGTITLVIKNLKVEDEGIYQCKAENSEGTAATMTYLTVKCEYMIFRSCLLRF